MKVLTEKSKKIVENANIGMEYTENGDVVINIEGADNKSSRYFLEPDAAVRLWRCFLGELDENEFQFRHSSIVHNGVPEKASAVYEEPNWHVCFGNDVDIDIGHDQAMALAWATERCVAGALRAKEKSVPKEPAAPAVWVLASKVVFGGDSAEDGVDSVDGHEAVFSSRELALVHLREFLRPIVNDANTESHWESGDEDVDDVLDEIIEEGAKIGDLDLYTYEGSKWSFKVTIRRCEVNDA